MCRLCPSPAAHDHAPDPTRRAVLRTAATLPAAFGGLLAAGCAIPGKPTALSSDALRAIGGTNERTLLKGGIVLSMDPAVGNFAPGDVLLEGRRIVAVGANLSATARVIDAGGMIVMPGFVDTHHHQFETAIRSLLPDAILRNSASASTELDYVGTVLGKFAPAYRPEDVYISELYASYSQLDAGVTTVLDVSQIHNSPEHSDASVEALVRSGRRSVLGYFEGFGPGARYPGDARRLKQRWFSSQDQLVTMAMGGEMYLPGYENAWALGRELGIPIVAHVVGSSRKPPLEALGKAGQIRADNLFIHMTELDDALWKLVADAGAKVSMAVPIEMAMRHGTPPLQKAIDFGVQASLSSDVECTMTADMFTIMRSAFTLQRMFANQASISGRPAPALMKSRDALRLATLDGAKCLGLERRTGSLTPGKDADLVLLDSNALNVAPLNDAAGAVVTLMDRSNVAGVMVAGRVRKWNHRLLDVDVARLTRDMEKSRDYLFSKVGMQQNVLRGS